MLSKLSPKRVFYYFQKLCSVPHGSGNTKIISDLCVEMAKGLNLPVIQDELGNVIIKKAASCGYEDHPTVIIQGHLDMVCEKAPNSNINFETDGLSLGIDGDWIYADGTTLGGDDGIAVAMAFAVLEDNSLCHPPIEVLLTIDEETGMDGASGLDSSMLEGRTLINIDSEEEGVLTVGCAGGARAEITLPHKLLECNEKAYKITLDGLIGGHSGAEIDKGRQNANIMMGKFLKLIPECKISYIAGGLKDNAIPVLCACTAVSPIDPRSVVEEFIKANRVDTDAGLNITVEDCEVNSVLCAEDSKRIIEFLNVTPNGIVKMSEDIEGLPETSLNLGILSFSADKAVASFAVRSAVSNEKTKLLKRLEMLAESIGGSYSSYGHYPAWEYKKESRLRDTMCRVFEQKTGKKPSVITIHAGLECGLLSEKLKGLDAVSIGPDMREIHTCRERLSISSTARVYDYLCEVLKQL